MFDTSRDLLYVVLSFCILWFTVFLCWLIYQAARVLRNANNIIESLSHKLELITEAVEFMKHKVDSLSGHMGVVSNMVASLVEKFFVNKLSQKLQEKEGKKKKK